jgi:hypothetical protein
MTNTLIIKDPTGPKAPAGSKKAARPARKSTTHLKLLLSAAALAATLDGWALLAAHDQSRPADTETIAAAAPAADARVGADPREYLLDRPPIPTVVPVPGTVPRAALPSQPAQRAVSAAPAAKEAPAPVMRPALRKVSPPPVAVTRSSR